jgi:NTE family protein
VPSERKTLSNGRLNLLSRSRTIEPRPDAVVVPHQQIARPAEGPVGVVLAGGGARGAYEMGALSVLLPALADRQQPLPSVIVGTSVGAINGTWLAANSHSAVDEIVANGLELWHRLRWESVVSSVWSPRSLRPVLRYVGGLFSRKIRVEYLLDTTPLSGTLEQFFKIERVETNISDGSLDAVAVVATRAANGRTVVFHCGGPRVLADDFRGIDYVRGRLTWEHVRASSAFPAVFRPVEITPTSRADLRGWYVDGGTRLNTPIKPALALGAKRVIVIALHSVHTKVSTPDSGRCPDVFDGAGQVMQALFADPLAHDIRTLASRNELAEQGETSAKLVPYILIAPSRTDSIGAIARDVFARKYAKWSGLLTSAGIVGRLLHADAATGSGELFSYLFFEPEFTKELIALGAKDANAWLDSRGDGDIWQHGPLL